MPVCLYNDLMLCSDQTRAILSYIKTTHVHVLGILYLIFDVHDWNLHVYCLGINEPIIVCFFVGFLISNDGSSIFKGKVFKFKYISNAILAGAHRKQTGVKHAVASKPRIKSLLLLDKWREMAIRISEHYCWTEQLASDHSEKSEALFTRQKTAHVFDLIAFICESTSIKAFERCRWVQQNHSWSCIISTNLSLFISSS